MYTKPALVQSINLKELEMAHALYFPYIKDGLTPANLSEALIGTKDHWLMQNYLTLIDLVTPHLQKSSVIVKLQQCKEETQLKIQAQLKQLKEQIKNPREYKEHERRIIQENFFHLKQQFEKIFSLNNNYSSLAANIYKMQDDDIDSFVKRIIEYIEKDRETNEIDQTSKDIIRAGSVYINNIPIDLQALRQGSSVIAGFKKILESYHIDENIISFLLHYFNQKHVNYGGLMYHEKALIESLFPYLGKKPSDATKCFIEVDSKGEITVRNEKLWINSESSNGREAMNIPMKSSVVFKISHNPSFLKPNNIQIKIIEGDLEIYDEQMRELFLYHRSRDVLNRIRTGQELLESDYTAINLYLTKYKKNGELLDLSHVDADTIFLLAWNNVGDAEELFEHSPQNLKAFFARSAKEIKDDLTRIYEKHRFYPELERCCDVYFEHLNLIMDKNWLRIASLLSGREREKIQMSLLSLSDSNLIKNIITSVLVEKNIPSYELTSILKEFAEDPLLAEDVKNRIATVFHNSREFNNRPDLTEILGKIFSKIDNSKKQLSEMLQNYNIRTRLGGVVLTQYALMNEKIATDLLKQSAWERFIAKCKSLFRNTVAILIPSQQFKSFQLREIIKKFPRFWQTKFAKKNRTSSMFGRERNYRRELTADDLYHILITLKDSKDTHSYQMAVSAVVNDEDLRAKVQKKLTLRDAVELSKILPNDSFSTLTNVSRKNKQDNPGKLSFWDDIHLKLSEQELYDFYLCKLKQDADRGVDLALHIVDFWTDNREVFFATWRADLVRKSREIALLNQEKGLNLPDPLLVMRRAIVSLVSKDKMNIYLNEFLPTPRHYGGDFSPAQLRKLHKDFLSKHSFVKKIIKEPKFAQCLKTHEYLFELVLNSAKEHKDKELIIATFKLMGNDKILDYLNRVSECQYLISQMLADSGFFNDFISLPQMSHKIISTIFRTTNPQELLLLVLQQGDNKFHDKKLIDIILESEDFVKKMLEYCSVSELSKLINKYPFALQHILKQQNFNKYREKLYNACKLCRLSFPADKITAIHNLDTQFGALFSESSSVTKAVLKEDPSLLLASNPQEIYKYLTRMLAGDYSLHEKKEILSHILYNRSFLHKILQENFSDYTDNTFFHQFLRALESMSEKVRDNDFLQYLHHILNYSVLLAIAQPERGKIILQSAEFKKIIAKYLNSEDFAILLLQNGNYAGIMELLDYQLGVEHIMQSTALGKFHTLLFANKAFQESLLNCMLKSGSLGMDSKGNPLFKSEDIMRLLQNNQFNSCYLISALVRQYRKQNQNNGIENEIDFRSILLQDEQVLKKAFRIQESTSAKDIYSIFIHEDKMYGKSAIIDQILTRPLFDYLLDNLDNDSLLELCSVLFKDYALLIKKYPSLLTVIKENYFKNISFRQVILSSQTILKQFSEQFDAKNPVYYQIITRALDCDQLTNPVSRLMEFSGISITKNFLLYAEGKEIIQLLIRAAKHKLDKIVSMIIDTGNEKMLSDKVDPRDQIEYLLWIFELSQNANNQSTFSWLQKIDQAMQKFLIKNDRFYLELPIDKLVDLYIKDGMLTEKEVKQTSVLKMANREVIREMKYYFRSYIKGNTSFHLLDQMFLFAQEDKLLELFSADLQLCEIFVSKICANEDLGQELARKITDQHDVRAFKNLPKFILRNFPIVTQVKIMKSFPAIRERLMLELQNTPQLLDGKYPDHDYEYVKLIAEYQSTSFFEYLIQALNRLSNKNSVIDCLLKSLDDKTVSQFTRLIILNAEVRKDNNLIELLFTSLHPRDIVDLCKKDAGIEKKFILQFMHKPSLLKEFAKTEEFLRFFRECNNPVLFYIEVLCHAEISSEILPILQKELQINPKLKDKILKMTIVEELAVIVNAEAKKPGKILSDAIFADDSYCSQMLRAVYLLDADLVISPDFRENIKKPIRLEAYKKNFVIDTAQIKSTADHKVAPCDVQTHLIKFTNSHKIVSFEHACTYLYALFLSATSNDFYYNFMIPVSFILHLDKSGVLRFNYVGETPPYNPIVPPRFAILYYEVFANLNFYNRDIEIRESSGMENLQISLEKYPNLRASLLSSVVLKDGKFIFTKFDSPRSLGPVPVHYQDAVLYAKSLSPDFYKELNRCPELVDMYLDSVVYDHSSKELRYKNKPFKVSQSFEKTIYQIIRDNLNSSKMKNLLWIALLPEIDELMRNDQILCENIVASIRFEGDKGVFIFFENHLEVPEYYKNVLLKALSYLPHKCLSPQDALKVYSGNDKESLARYLNLEPSSNVGKSSSFENLPRLLSFLSPKTNRKAAEPKSGTALVGSAFVKSK